MTDSSHRRSAYTLLEMLMVLSIVALLGALLFAVFSRVREKGRTTHCQSNLRQLVLAFQQYSSDYNTFPYWYNEHPPSNPLPNKYSGLPWGRRIQPYINNVAIFQCPSENTRASLDPMFLSKTGGYTDYSYNLNLSGLADSKITRPSEVIMIFDNFSAAAYMAQSAAPGPSPGSGGDIHSGGANFAFVDGHVKWIDVKEESLTSHFFFPE